MSNWREACREGLPLRCSHRPRKKDAEVETYRGAKRPQTAPTYLEKDLSRLCVNGTQCRETGSKKKGGGSWGLVKPHSREIEELKGGRFVQREKRELQNARSQKGIWVETH